LISPCDSNVSKGHKLHRERLLPNYYNVAGTR
jgi:hypothetical protein